jgi:hypothetical protein
MTADEADHLAALTQRVSVAFDGESLQDVVGVTAALCAHAISRFYSTRSERLAALEQLVFPVICKHIEAFDDHCRPHNTPTTTLQ